MSTSRRKFLISIPILYISLTSGCLRKKTQKKLTLDNAIVYWLDKYKHHHSLSSKAQKYFKTHESAKKYLVKSLSHSSSKDYKQIFLKTRINEFKKDQSIELNGYIFAPVEVALLRLALKD